MIIPGYALPVLAGLLLSVLFPSGARIPPEHRNLYRGLQLATLLGAVVGAKLAQLAGDYGWPVSALPEGVTVLSSGRSLPGGLLGGFVTAEVLKPILRYPLPPNDSFARILPFSVAIGRLGCVIGGCCRGVPWEGPLAMHYDGEAFARFPAPFAEMAFHLLCGLLFVALVHRGLLAGRVFSLYLVMYGVFRLVTEPLRDTPHLLWGYSVYQALAAAMVVVGSVALWLRTERTHGRRAEA